MNANRSKGFTLHESMICLAIFFSLGWGTSAISQAVAKQRMHTTHSELATLINLARWQALSNAERVTLCPLQNDSRCRLPWSGTLTSFIDKNGNRTLDADETILAHITLQSGTTLFWRGMNPTHSLHFSASGMTFVSNGTFTLCQHNVSEIRRLIINKQGRIKTERENGACPF